MMFCGRCGTQFQEGDKFCRRCGAASETAPNQAINNTVSYNEGVAEHNTGSVLDIVTEKVNRLAGGEGAVKLHIKDLFTDVLKKHTSEDAENIFISGTASTTPELSSIDTSWPKPWLYSRVFLVLATAFVILELCMKLFNNGNCVPGVIFLGSFAVPVSLFIFFFEMNVPRNISFFNVLKIFFVGGTASILATLLLCEIVDPGELDFKGAILTGIVEELGKLFIVVYFIGKIKPKFFVSGLLIGATVGAGFAAFESAGYAFNVYFESGADAMIENIYLRAFLSPGGHIVWAAISGYAVMLANSGKVFSISETVKSGAFWGLFAIPVVLHAIWDMPIEFGQEFYFVQLVLTAASWIVILVLIQNCLNRLSAMITQSKQAFAVNTEDNT